MSAPAESTAPHPDNGGQLVAALTSDPERFECALYPARPALVSRLDGRPNGWGLGFVQGGDVLLQKRPRADSPEVDFFSLARTLKADAFVGRAALDDLGRLSADNADPFRFRSWLFASLGELDGFESIRERLLPVIPEFLRRNLRGQAGSEHIFHLFLSFLHDAGRLESHSTDADAIDRALRDTTTFLDRSLIAAGLASSHLTVVATNGRSLAIRTSNRPAAFLNIHGIADCAACRQRLQSEADARRVAHDSLRAVVIEANSAGRTRAGWTPIPAATSLLVGPDRIPRLAP